MFWITRGKKLFKETYYLTRCKPKVFAFGGDRPDDWEDRFCQKPFERLAKQKLEPGESKRYKLTEIKKWIYIA